MTINDETVSQSNDAVAIRLDFGPLSLMNEKKTSHEETPSTSASSSPSLSPSPLAVRFPAFSLESSEDTAATSSAKTNSWVAPASQKSLRTHNPIRAIVDPIVVSSIKSGQERGDGKDQISLALGDPTAYGLIPPCPAILTAVSNAIHSPSMAAGYVNACGTPEARAAIARHHSTYHVDGHEQCSMSRVSPDDVVVANGASGALELALTALLDEGSAILVPRPGFPLYSVIAESHGASVVHYDLLPDRGWECDIDHIESILAELNADSTEDRPGIGDRVVRGILINNPSNPTGAVYSERHLIDIVKLAEKYRLPIISDEIYGDMTLDGHLFHPMGGIVAKMGRNVPVITASGLGKQYLVPGWRLGWLVFHDSHHGAIQEVKKGVQRLAQVVLGASHLAQTAIPAVLNPTDESDRFATAAWKKQLHEIIQNQARLVRSLLNECHGLHVIPPKGAMYAMVKIDVDKFDDSIEDDVSFMRLLLDEENIVVLPGKAFGMKSRSCCSSKCYVFRVVFCAPENVVRAAVERISCFCLRHKCSG